MGKRYYSSCETRLRATERHLPYGIPQFHLPLDTVKRVSPQSQTDRQVLDLPTPECEKAKLTSQQTVSHPSCNHWQSN